MKEEKDIKGLLKKFVLNQCSEREIKDVIEYFRARADSTDFLTVEEVMEMMNAIPEMDERSADRIYQQIIADTNQKRKQAPTHLLKKPFYRRYAAVIAVICVLAAGYFISQNRFLATQPDRTISQVDDLLNIPGEAITLKRENGNFEIINPDGSRKVTDAQGNVIGEQEKGVLTYNAGEKIEKLVHNTLTVPYVEWLLLDVVLKEVC